MFTPARSKERNRARSSAASGARSRVRTAALALSAVAALTLATTAMTAPSDAAAAPAPAPKKQGPTSVAYVEVNNNSMLNVGKYRLANGGGNAFDVAVIFAANINYDTTKKAAYLHFNENVQRVLDNAVTEIRPLQEKGIKVVLSVLGNHQGAGFANFPSKQAASTFAKQLSDTVSKYRLDGIDFDDEYAEYGNNGTGQPNASSFVHLVTALRANMPDKIISLYNIGPAASRLSYGGVDISSKFTYAWNPYYGTWQVPGISLPKSKLSPAAVEIGGTSRSTVANLARRTVNEGYGVYLTYNLDGNDRSADVSAFTRELYGSDAVYTR
ncbi:chitinase [Streptomyces sp. SID335]|nr:chitinase [Streptomyces sp. SID335]MYZ11969.1 chitinase [Streptomyces sp. SID337]NDZ84603.1 chitinase [Streptomyces sp. SID10115]NDZ99908.1 chitinase [Streptomyces sp. SID10116]NEB45257.1 chitinase [Streptomyces sp. SID339]